MRGQTFILLFMTLFAILAQPAIASTQKLIAYVVDWEVPKNIQWKKLDHIVYSFAEPNSHGVLESITSSNLKSLVSEAHKNHVTVSVSVGGWSASKYISNLVSSTSKINSFVDNIVAMVEKYNLDGVNMDWEYPNDPNGMACNIKNSKDTANYLKFVQSLSKALNAKYKSSHKSITLAVGTSVFNGANGNPLKTLDKSWASTVDSFYVMTYDISGSWMSKAGPNSPLNKASSSKYDSSVQQAVDAWHNAGIPKNKLVIGVPFYGTVLKTSRAITSSTGLYVKLASPSAIKGDQYDELSADPCSGAKKSYSGEYQWRSIVKNGILHNENGWKNYWDKTSATPYAAQSSQKKFLTYDNPTSIKDKVAFVNAHQLGGAMLWSLEMDDSKHTLLSSLQGVRK